MTKNTSSEDEKDVLPKIIVLEDKIIVLEEDWVEKNIGKNIFEYTEKINNNKISKEDGLGKIVEEFSKNETDTVKLEDKAHGVSQKSFYETDKRIEELYNSNMYKDNNPKDKDNIQDFIYTGDGNHEGLSVLEISGFRDMKKEEREKDRFFRKW